MSENEIQPISSDVPATIGGYKLGRGHEEPSDMDDVEIPRAKLIQFTSDEAQSADKNERLDPGILVNSISKEKLGEFFIPIFKFTNFICWNPRKKDDPNYDPAYEIGELVFQSTDRQDQRVVEGIKFGPNGEPPKVTKYLNYLCYFVGHKVPLVLSFSKTSFNAGKRLNTLTQMSGGDMFGQKYRLSVKLEDKAGTKYFVFNVTPAGPAPSEEYKLAEHWYDEYRGKKLKVHAEETNVKTEEAWAE